MVNVYVGRLDSTTPTGWPEIGSGYRDRLILLGGTALETGGNDEHDHTGGASTDTVNATLNYHYSTATPYAINGSHNHPCTLSNVGGVNHVPAYKTYRLVGRSVSNWNGIVPSGSIVFRETVPANWTRESTGETHFFRISGTAGLTGGNDAPVGHGVAGTVDNCTQPNVLNGNVGTPNVATTGHNHGSFSGTIGSHAPDWAYWGCGLIKASSDQFIKKDSYLLFDGNPGAGWALEDQTGRYVKVVSSYTPTAGGTNTTYVHDHTGNTTSGEHNGSTLVTASPGTHWSIFNHTHIITVNLDSKSIAPAYVRLYLYKSLKNFGSAPQIFVFC